MTLPHGRQVMKALTLPSWYLARSLGVTKTPPEGEYFAVVIEGGPMLFWPMFPELLKENV